MKNNDLNIEFNDHQTLPDEAVTHQLTEAYRGLMKEISESFGVFMSGDEIIHNIYESSIKNVLDIDETQFNKNYTLFEGIIKFAELAHLGEALSGDINAWSLSVREMAGWYMNNIHKYDQSGMIFCPLVNKNVRMDCSGFTTSCLWRYGALNDIAWAPTSTMYTNDVQLGAKLQKAGFRKMSYDINILKPYDIITYPGHVEVFAGIDSRARYMSYAWGACHDISHGGLPCGMAHKKQGYNVIWRCEGNGTVSIDNSRYENYYSGIKYNGSMITIDSLMAAMPKIARSNRGIAGAILAALDKYGDIVGLTEKGKLYILGQMAWESGYFTTMEEYGSGKQYEMRKTLGNVYPGDGPKFKGRGAIQVTGRANYTYIRDKIFPKFGITTDIVANPETVSKDYGLGAAISMAWLMIPGNGKYAVAAANAGDTTKLTKMVNGGLSHLSDRVKLTNEILKNAK